MRGLATKHSLRGTWDGQDGESSPGRVTAAEFALIAALILAWLIMVVAIKD